MNHPLALVIVLDAVGIRTIDHMLDVVPRDVSLPNFSLLGLGELVAERHRGRLGRTGNISVHRPILQASASADSVIGHREMCGIIDARTYNLFPDGFPREYISALEERIGVKTLCNRIMGGMEAIAEFAEEHECSRAPIVYASKCDPLIQIAMNEQVIAVSQQHHIVDVAFDLAPEMGVQITRAIARPYVRTDTGFKRTANRHDVVLPLTGPTLVDILRDHGVFTCSVGKPSDLVNTHYDEEIKLTKPNLIEPALGLRFAHPEGKDTNPLNVQGIIQALVAARICRRPSGTFVFANLVDCDSLYGHTCDASGALKSLEEVDRILPLITGEMNGGDLLLITADHGMEDRGDYGYHSREPVPLLVQRIGSGADLGGLKLDQGEGLTDVGMLVAQMFGLQEEFQSSITHIPAQS